MYIFCSLLIRIFSLLHHNPGPYFVAGGCEGAVAHDAMNGVSLYSNERRIPSCRVVALHDDAAGAGAGHGERIRMAAISKSAKSAQIAGTRQSRMRSILVMMASWTNQPTATPSRIRIVVFMVWADCVGGGG
jgi:hypothetical protein